MEFLNIVEQVLQEENTNKSAFRTSHGIGILGGLVTDTGVFHSKSFNHPHDGSWHGRCSKEDTAIFKQD